MGTLHKPKKEIGYMCEMKPV